MSVRKNLVPIYPVLEAEIARRGLKKKDLAERAALVPRGLSRKLTGETDFSLREALAIHSFFSDIPMEKLFERGDFN